ncbi:MAG: IS110 family transposase [Desulfatitalea sp.]
MTKEVKRYARFCQLRTEIRASRNHLIIGIDVAKDKHHAFFGTATGKTLWRRLIFNNDIEGFNCLMDQTKTLCAEHRLTHVVFGLEPTGNYHKTLAYWLIRQGHSVVLVSGKAVKDNRQLIDGRWDKNDIKDSANVADLIGQGKCQFFEQPDASTLALRTFLSLRKRLKKEEHSLRMQIRNGLVAKYFPEMDRHWGNSLEQNLEIVRHYLDPRKIATSDFKSFARQVAPRIRSSRSLQRLEAIHQAAKDSVGLPVDPSAEFEAIVLVERHYRVVEHINQTMEQVESVCVQQSGYQLLLSIPGCGPYIAALILAAIGDPHRFTSRNQVIRLAGLDLNANRSGKKSNESVPKISKRGDADLRYGLYQAAFIASYHNKAFARLFARTLKGREGERGIKTKARVKLAAKMMVIAWTMLKNNELFDPARLLAEPVPQR